MLEGWEVFLMSIGKERRSREGCAVCGGVDCGGGFVLADESGVGGGRVGVGGLERFVARVWRYCQILQGVERVVVVIEMIDWWFGNEGGE